jgi:hypothetical protein
MNPETEKVINDLRDHFGIDVELLVKRGLLPVSAAKNGWCGNFILPTPGKEMSLSRAAGPTQILRMS